MAPLSTTLDGNANVGKFFRTKKPPINEWTSVEISQAKRGSKYMFSFVIKGETLWSVENTKPMHFSDVHVYASSAWYVAQVGSIRGFKIENMMPVLSPQWSDWGSCTKNRTRPEASCIAGHSTDSCPMEVETEKCTFSGPANNITLPTLNLASVVSVLTSL